MQGIIETGRLIVISMAVAFILTYPPHMILLRGWLLGKLKRRINGVIYGILVDGAGCFYCMTFWTTMAVTLISGYGWYAFPVSAVGSFTAFILYSYMRARWRILL